MTIEIRAMRPADVDAVIALRGNEPGDRRPFFAFAATHPACEAIVAVDCDDVVGSGLGTRNGRVGWVGAVYVAEDRRRAGLGRALTEDVMERLAVGGCRTFVLVASEMGRPLYASMGFEVVDWYVNLDHEAAPGASEAVPSGARALASFRRSDLPEASVLDAAATGEDRAHLLDACADVPGGLALRGAEGRLRAYLVRTPWRLGAIVAPDPADARLILGARLAAPGPGRSVRVGLLASNADGIARLTAGGWTEAWRAPRMQRGDPLAWDPSAIWGQFSFAMG